MEKRIFSIVALIMFSLSIMSTSKSYEEYGICSDIADAYIDYLDNNYELDSEWAIDAWIETFWECENGTGGFGDIDGLDDQEQ